MVHGFRAEGCRTFRVKGFSVLGFYGFGFQTYRVSGFNGCRVCRVWGVGSSVCRGRLESTSS